jgi:hypothetical protein
MPEHEAFFEQEEPEYNPGAPGPCNCESSYCDHERGCPNHADGSILMDYVGSVCSSCAERTRETGGGRYLHSQS